MSGLFLFERAWVHGSVVKMYFAASVGPGQANTVYGRVKGVLINRLRLEIDPARLINKIINMIGSSDWRTIFSPCASGQTPPDEVCPQRR